MLVYKVFRAGEWAEFDAHGESAGSPADLADGFVHLSTAAQLPGTLERHFPGETGLVVLALDASRLGSDLAWEPSRGGALFPHLHRRLRREDVAWSRPLSAVTVETLE